MKAKIAESVVLVKANGHSKFHYPFSDSDNSIWTQCGICFNKEPIERKPLKDISEKFDICGNCLNSIS